MAMRTMNTREKNLGVIVTLVVMGGMLSTVNRSFKRQTDQLQGQLFASQQRLQQAQTMLATTAAPAPVAVAKSADPTAVTAPTLTLLKDLTIPRESTNVRVVGLERIGDKMFRITLQGKFPEMMRFLSYLERKDSRFGVTSAELEKVKHDPTVLNTPGAVIKEASDEPSREVKGVFRIGYRG